MPAPIGSSHSLSSHPPAFQDSNAIHDGSNGQQLGKHAKELIHIHTLAQGRLFHADLERVNVAPWNKARDYSCEKLLLHGEELTLC